MSAQDGHRTQLLTRWGQLKTERATWMAHWQEITTYLLPRAGRYFPQDRNRGTRVHNNIYDSTGTRALRILGAGMMAGATSPARPWFRLGTADPDLNAYTPVKLWLADVTARMQLIFQKSNTYRALHQIYEELGAFGTGVSILLPDHHHGVHHYPLTAGEYAVAADYQGHISTLYREFETTVGALVDEFGREACSPAVKNLWDRGALDTWVPIIHAIEPRTARDTTKRDARNMPWKSCYFEAASHPDVYLRESGFQEFPAVAPRWATTGGDVYGHSPGMEALGDIKQLQHEQLRKAQGIDLKTNPPLQVPSAMKNRDLDTLPGGVTYIDANAPAGGIRTAFDVAIDLSHLLHDIQDVRERIRGAFYADLFLMLANATDTRMTATEVAERHEEKMLMLGPVLERLHNELLDPLIDITFSHMVTQGLLPPPPEELQGMDLSVEFISMLAQAQRAVGTNAVDRFVAGLGSVAQLKPEALDKFDADHWADTYSDMLGLDPRLLVAGPQVARVRAARQQAAQAQSQQASAALGAETARTLSQAQTSEPSALTNAIDMFSGYSTP